MTVGGYRVRILRRATLPGWEAALFSVLALGVGLFLFGFVFLFAGASPMQAYQEIFRYAFFNANGVPLTMSRFIFLALSTYAFIVPFRAGEWNIGMTGQIYIGGLAAYAVVYAFGGKASKDVPLNPALVLPLMVLAAAVGGALMGGIAGYLKGRWDVNEIVVTMMLNFIAFWLVSHMIKDGGPFMNVGGRGEGFALPTSLRAPMVLGVPFTILFVLVLAVALEFLFARTSLGYQIRAAGLSPKAARYAGMDTTRISLWVFLIGGGIAGLAAYHYFAAVPGVYKIPRNYGEFGDLAFFGIICGLIALGNSLATLPVALLFGGLSIGGRYAQGKLHLGFGVDYALMGVLMITLVAFQFFYRYRIVVEPLAAEPMPSGTPAPSDLASYGGE